MPQAPAGSLSSAVMYLQRGPTTAENEPTTHRTHKMHTENAVTEHAFSKVPQLRQPIDHTERIDCITDIPMCSRGVHHSMPSMRGGLFPAVKEVCHDADTYDTPQLPPGAADCLFLGGHAA